MSHACRCRSQASRRRLVWCATSRRAVVVLSWRGARASVPEVSARGPPAALRAAGLWVTPERVESPTTTTTAADLRRPTTIDAARPLLATDGTEDRRSLPVRPPSPADVAAVTRRRRRRSPTPPTRSSPPVNPSSASLFARTRSRSSRPVPRPVPARRPARGRPRPAVRGAVACHVIESVNASINTIAIKIRTPLPRPLPLAPSPVPACPMARPDTSASPLSPGRSDRIAKDQIGAHWCAHATMRGRFSMRDIEVRKRSKQIRAPHRATVSTSE